MDYASKGVGTAGLTTGIIGTGLGAINSGLFSGLFGGAGNNNYVNKETFEVQLKLIESQKDNAILAADLSSEKKMVEVFNAATNRTNAVRDELMTQIRNLENKVDANIAAQGVINCQCSSQLTLQSSQIAQLFGMTKTVIPADNVCPKPMPQYNSWVAPTNP